MRYFAYGSNMSRAGMRSRCPGARALGTARLSGWRFVIGRDGYASIVPGAGASVFGVLWQLEPRDVAALNAYEGVDRGLYARRYLPLACTGGRCGALVYVGRPGAPARPRPGHVELVLDAACEWRLPPDYVQSLRRWRQSAWRGARAVDTGEAG